MSCFDVSHRQEQKKITLWGKRRAIPEDIVRDIGILEFLI